MARGLRAARWRVLVVYTAASIAKTDWIIVKGICDWADGNKKMTKPKDNSWLPKMLQLLQCLSLVGAG